MELVAGEAAAQDGGADGGEAGLTLRGDADVVAVDVVGDSRLQVAVGRGIELVAELVLRWLRAWTRRSSRGA